MKSVVVVILICTLSFLPVSQGNRASDQVSGFASKVGMLGAISHEGVAVQLGSACGFWCASLIIASAAQAVEYWLGRDNGEDTCADASNDAICHPNPTTGGGNPGSPTSGGGGGVPGSPTTGFSGTPTGSTTGLRVPIPTGGGITGGITGLGGMPKPMTPNQKLPEILAKRPALKDVLNKLKDKGFSLDMDHNAVNTPNGPVGLDKLNDPATMAAMGMTPEGMKIAEGVVKKEQEKLKMQLAALARENGGEGGGGGALGANGPGNEDDALKEYMKRMMARMPAQEKNNINGLSVMVNGEPVGIASGDIFKTIEQRYDKIESTGLFLPPGPAPAGPPRR